MTESAAPVEKKRRRCVKSSERAMKEARRRKWTAWTVERRLPRGFVTIDMGGFADIVVLDDQDGVLAVQACGATDVQPHMEKLAHDPKVLPNVARWLARRNRLSIWSFRKLKYARGSKAVRWTCREIRASLSDGVVKWIETAEPAA